MTYNCTYNIITVDTVSTVGFVESKSKEYEEGMVIMDIKISSIAQIPIYEQIENQIKEMIMTGVFTPGMQLPSIRILARDLKVGIITCRRAYDDLCAQGILVTHPGKGVFVADVRTEQIKVINMEMLDVQIRQLCDFAITAGISKSELMEQVNIFFDKHEK